MYVIINILLLLSQIILLVKAVHRLSRKITDFGAIFIIIYSIWYVPIIYDLLTGGRFFGSAYRNLMQIYSYYFVYDTSLLTQLNLVTTLIMVAFEIGYSSQCSYESVNFTFQTEHKINERKYILAQGVILIVWLLLEIRGFIKSGISVSAFFSSTRKDIYGSEIVHNLVLKLPIVLFGNSLYYNATKNIKKIGIWYWAIIIVAAFQTSQRREMISDFLFSIILFVSYNATLMKKNGGNSLKINDKVKKSVIVVFMVALCMVPLFWYLRVYSNQVINHGATHVEFSRSFLELLLSGSGVTGFPTLIIYKRFGEENGINYIFRELIFTLESFIPRSIFPGKMKATNILIRDTLGVSNNLSMFYINELYYTYWVFAIPISCAVGYILSKLYNKFTSSSSFEDKFYMAFFLSNIIKLFKNGLSSFAISTVFLMIIIYVDFSYLGIAEHSRNSKRYINNSGR